LACASSRSKTRTGTCSCSPRNWTARAKLPLLRLRYNRRGCEALPDGGSTGGWMGMNNTVKTVVLMGALMGLFAGLGYLIFGGVNGLVFFLVIAGIFNFISYWFSDKLALAMAGALEV